MPFWEETDWNEYINSGVLVLDLERIRKEHDLMEEAIDFWNTYGWSFPDQDALNYLLRGKKSILPARFNAFSKDYHSVEDGMFYHYTYMAGDADRLGVIDRLYLSYYERSPFYQGETGKKEKIRFLRRLKDRAEPYLRLRELTGLSCEEVSKLGWGLLLRGEYDQVVDLLSGCTYKNAEGEEGFDRKEYCRELSNTGIMAKALHKLHRTQEAADRLEAAFAKAPEEESSYIGRDICEMQQSDLLGELYYALGRYEEAERAYLGAVYFGTNEKRFQAVISLEHLIRCALKAGRTENARKYLYMLQTVCPEPDRLKIYGLQIEIAEKREKNRQRREGS